MTATPFIPSTNGKFQRVVATIQDAQGHEVPLDIRFDASDAAPTYIGLNYDNVSAGTAVPSWTVYKFTYSGSDVTRIQRKDAITWDARGSSF